MPGNLKIEISDLEKFLIPLGLDPKSVINLKH
jgi:hypothetical protein